MSPSPTATLATPSLAGRDLLLASDLDAAEATAILDLAAEIGRASCRERV